jgi:hypothetical protein
MITRRELVLGLIVVVFGFTLCYKATEPIRVTKRRTACYANLKQIGFAMRQYAQDNDDTFPRASYGNDADSSSYKWMDAILPYAKDTSFFNCPIDKVNQPYRPRTPNAYGSYVINNAYFLPGDKQTPPAGVKLDKISKISTILVSEGVNDFEFAWPDARRTPALEGDNPYRLDSIRGRHGTGVYGTALKVDCEGGSSTESLDFIRKTKVINGQKIYTAFTIEDDES